MATLEEHEITRETGGEENDYEDAGSHLVKNQKRYGRGHEMPLPFVRNGGPDWSAECERNLVFDMA